MYYYVYRDQSNQWRWTFFAANGRKIANCGEGYFNRDDCVHGINLVAGSGGMPIRYA